MLGLRRLCLLLASAGLSACLSRELDTGRLPTHDAGSCSSCAPGLDGGCTCSLTAELGACRVGQYRGVVDIPEYKPAAAGVCGLFPLFGGAGRGEWTFDLVGESTDGGLAVREGTSCIDMLLAEGGEGLPDGGTDRPVLAVSGQVDCSTGALALMIRGYYRSVSVCNSATQEYFSVKGTMTARFDPDSGTFEQGAIDLREPPQLGDLLQITEQAGGRGTWSARYVGPPSLPDGGCDVREHFVDFSTAP